MVSAAADPADFIEVYDNALEASACLALIKRFETSGLAQRGLTGGGVDVSAKDSWDIHLNEHPGWADAQQLLIDAVLAGFKRYLRRYAQVALATSRFPTHTAAICRRAETSTSRRAGYCFSVAPRREKTTRRRYTD